MPSTMWAVYIFDSLSNHILKKQNFSGRFFFSPKKADAFSLGKLQMPKYFSFLLFSLKDMNKRLIQNKPLSQTLSI